MEFILALITLIILELILGIDNIIFISIVSNRLKEKKRNKAIIIGMTGAIFVRILLLSSLVWIIDNLKQPLFPIPNMDYTQVIELYKKTEQISVKLSLLIHTIGIREIILLIGGLFLISKTVSEIFHKMEGESKEIEPKTHSLFSIIIQIIAVDIVFSFDSILTAIGITDNLPAMILSVIIAVIIMMIFTKKLGDFMKLHPSMEILALSFLILIGFTLILDAVHLDIPRGYIYFALFFSMAVEFINLRVNRQKFRPIKLNPKIKDEINQQNQNNEK